MPSVVANGVRLFYQQLGDGPDVVFVHGLAANRAFWYLRMARVLQSEFRITLYDLRGHGASEMPKSGYTVEDMAADLQSLLDNLAIRQAMLVGHSFGGVVALRLAATQPRRVTRLAIADSRVNALQPEQRLQDGPALTDFETALVTATGAEDWLQETQVGLRFLEEVATSQLRGMRVRQRDGFVPFSAFNGSPKSALRWQRLLTETTAKNDFRAPVDLSEVQLAGVEQPTLLVYGGRSRCLPSCWALAELLPNREVVVIPRAGHFHPIVRPRVFVRHLLDFLVRERPVKAETLQRIISLEDQPEPEDASAG